MTKNVAKHDTPHPCSEYSKDPTKTAVTCSLMRCCNSQQFRQELGDVRFELSRSTGPYLNDYRDDYRPFDWPDIERYYINYTVAATLEGQKLIFFFKNQIVNM